MDPENWKEICNGRNEVVEALYERSPVYGESSECQSSSRIDEIICLFVWLTRHDLSSARFAKRESTLLLNISTFWCGREFRREACFDLLSAGSCQMIGSNVCIHG